MNVAERAARGRAARAGVPRSSHGSFEPSPERPDPVALLERQESTRIPELVPIRHGRMLVSPFAFFRGAAAVMASDLSSTPSSGLTVQCCGDAHLSNFGLFASVERKLVFDINDFDETLRGPWEWDVKRLASSVMIAAQDNGFGAQAAERAVLATVASYRSAMAEFASMRNLEIWYAQLEAEPALERFGSQLRPGARKSTRREIAKAYTDDNLTAFAKLTEEREGKPRIVANPPLIVPVSELATPGSGDLVFAQLNELLGAYAQTLARDRRSLLEQFELIDFARKVVGVGSVGTRAWIALLMGRDGKDPLVLQLKEAEASVLEEFLGTSEFANHGERVVEGQRLIQASSDVFLGWIHVDAGPEDRAGDFYGRQLRDWKGSAQIDRMKPSDLEAYGRLCGWTLARAHARSGDSIAIGAYLGGSPRFDRAILAFARAYAEQNQRDYEALGAAVKSGRLTATSGV
ncbi:MAG TPA: DUF2252 domain-containing protein [Solirubrobacteraceae bacterium]